MLELIKKDEDKVLYQNLLDGLDGEKQKEYFSDVLAYKFYERDYKESLDSLGYGGLSDVVEQKEILKSFYEEAKDESDYFKDFEDYLVRFKAEMMLENPYKLFSTWRAEEVKLEVPNG